MKQTHIGHLAIFVVNLLFGLNTPITKTILLSDYDISPLALTYFRYIGAAVAFWLAALVFRAPEASRKDILLFVLASVFGIVLNQTTFVVGLSTTSPVDASIVVTLTPIITMIFAAIFIKEPITTKKVVGVLIGCAGALLLILTSNTLGNAPRSLFGNMLCLLSCLSYGLYLTLFRNLIARNHPLTLMKWMFLFGTVMLLPFSYDSVIHVPYSSIPLDIYLRIGYVVLVATFLTYFLIPIGQVRIRPTTLTMYNYLQPVVTTLLAVYMGLDTFGWHKALAALLVFLGVYVVTKSKSRQQMEEQKLKEENKVQ